MDEGVAVAVLAQGRKRLVARAEKREAKGKEGRHREREEQYSILA